MNDIEALINQTTTTILNEWTAEAAASGLNIDDYIGDKLDEMEETEPEVAGTVGKAWLKRVLA